MEREKFIDMLNELRKMYKPNTVFDLDDYYDQVKYIPDDRINDLRAKIVSTCKAFPRPATLKDISKEFKTPFKKKKRDDVEINYDNCSVYYDNGDKCEQPVYKSSVDPYRCKKHFEQRVAFLKNSGALKSRIDYLENGPFPIEENADNMPLIKTLNAIKEKLNKQGTTL